MSHAPSAFVRIRENSAHEKETIHIGRMTEKGSAEPAAVRSATIVVGRRFAAAVLRTAREIISDDGRAREPPLSVCVSQSFFIAASARGVAAFPIPRRFAAMLAEISSRPFPAPADGKKNFIIGRSGFVKSETAPDFFKTFMIPHQRHILPIRESVSVTADDAPSVIAVQSAPVLPFVNEKTNAIPHIRPKTFPSIFCSSPLDFVLLDFVLRARTNDDRFRRASTGYIGTKRKFSSKYKFFSENP